MKVFAAGLVVLVVIVALVMLSVQYGRVLESCHSDGRQRVPVTGC